MSRQGALRGVLAPESPSRKGGLLPSADAAPAMIWISESKPSRSYFTTAWLTFTGRSLEQELGEGWQDNIHPEDRTRCAAHLAQSVQRQQPFQVEYRLRRADGEYRWILDIGTPHFDGATAFEGYVGSCVDITEQKHAAAALRDSEERFRQIIESADVWVWEIDANGVYTFSSPVVERLLGYAPDELVGRKRFYDFFLPADRDTLKDAALTAIAAGEPFRNFRNRNVHRDGHIVILETNGTPIRDARSAVVGYRGSDTDVTRQVKAQEALEESEFRYRAFFNQGPEGVVVIEPDTGRLLEFNEQVCLQLGYTRDELAKLRVSDIDATESEAEVREHLRRILHDGRDDFEAPHRTKRGEIRYVHVTAQVVTLGGDRVCQCVWRDVTERRANEQLMADQRQKLVASSKMASLGVMASGIAHEINNPLATICAAVELMESALAGGAANVETERLQGLLDKVTRNAERITRIVHALRTLAREGAKDPLEKVAVKTIVDMCLTLCRSRAYAHDVRLLAPEIAPELFVDARPNQIPLALVNILNNALDAVAGLDERWIELAVADAGAEVQILVRDSGTRPPDDILDALFDPFFTTKPSGKGMGLGLSISRSMMEDCGGQLYVDRSDPHTCFVLRLRKSHSGPR